MRSVSLRGRSAEAGGRGLMSVISVSCLGFIFFPIHVLVPCVKSLGSRVWGQKYLGLLFRLCG